MKQTERISWNNRRPGLEGGTTDTRAYNTRAVGASLGNRAKGQAGDEVSR